jgi:Na+/H+ antiporter NhaD/arsenite permease-like protein
MNKSFLQRGLALSAPLLVWPSLAGAASIDGAVLSAWWGLPFAGILLSIALFPLLAPTVWHHHYGKIAAGWALAFLLPFAVVYGPKLAAANFVHALLAEYISFIVLLTALYTVSGGIYIRGNLRGSPGLNTAILGMGAVLASVMGTTGASMLMIRPWIRMNRVRITAHHVVFFIFIVSNVGGALTPIGDPPLFLGYLKGVPDWWVAWCVAPSCCMPNHYFLLCVHMSCTAFLTGLQCVAPVCVMYAGAAS